MSKQRMKKHKTILETNDLELIEGTGIWYVRKKSGYVVETSFGKSKEYLEKKYFKKTELITNEEKKEG